MDRRDEAQRIIAELHERGWSWLGIARALGVDYSQVWRWRSGRTVPHGSVLAMLHALRRRRTIPQDGRRKGNPTPD